MNQELINKINEAIKNNDMEMIDKLSKEYNVKINVNTSSRMNMNTGNNLGNMNNLSSFNNGIDGNNVVQNVRLVSKTKINPEEMVNTDNNNYFRDIPCNNDLFIIYFLSSIHGLMVQESDIFGAFLLRWIKEDKVSYIIKKKGLFKRRYAVFKFNDNVIIEDELERKIYDLIKNISRDNILDVNEFNKWLNNRAFEFNIFLNELKMYSHDRMVKAGLQIPVNDVNNQNNNMMTQQYISNNHNGGEVIDRNKQINRISGLTSSNGNNLISESGNVKIYSSKSFQLTPKYHEYLQQIADFKKFIKEFSLIHKKDVLEIKLWGDYLAVSYLLGIADDVTSQLDNLVPGFKTGNVSKKTTVKIKVPGNIPSDEVGKYIKDEMDKRKDNMFKF